LFMKWWMPIALFWAQSLAAEGIFQYHEDFRSLPKMSERLAQLETEIVETSSFLTDSIEVHAALSVQSSVELLRASVRFVLIQHAASVESFGKTGFYSEDHMKLAVQLLLKNSEVVKDRCRSQMNLVRRPSLFQIILGVDGIASELLEMLKAYGPEKKDSKGEPNQS